MKKIIILLIIISFVFVVNLNAQLNTNAPWPMFGQNLHHTGWSNMNVVGPQKNPVIDWKITGFGYILPQAAINNDGIIYFGSFNSNFYAVTNGAIKWVFPTGGSLASSPTIDTDGIIYFGCYDNKLYALNPNGTLKWSFLTGGSVNSSSIGDDNTIYCGSLDNKLYAVTNGVEKWSFTTGNEIRNSCVAIGSDGTVYFGSKDTKLYAVTNGVEKWSFTTGGSIASSPALDDDGTVYFQSYDNKFYAVTNGVEKWSYNIISGFWGSPSIGDDGTIYIASFNDGLYAFNPNGTLKWNYMPSLPIQYENVSCTPVIDANNTIYLAVSKWLSFSNGQLLAITNGQLKWSIKLGGGINSTPSIDDKGNIYIGNFTGSFGGEFFAIKQNNEPQLSWSGTVGYITDGIEPNAITNSQLLFKFEVKYSDIDGDNPLTNQVWVDLNDNSVFELNEKFNMGVKSGFDYKTGYIFTNSIQITNIGDGILNYRFYFTDKYGYTPVATNSGFQIFTLNIGFDKTAPANIASLVLGLLPSGKGVTLQWGNPSDVDLAGFYIVRKEGSYPNDINDGVKITVNNANTSSYLDNDLEKETQYYYIIYTFDNAGNISSGIRANIETLSGLAKNQFTVHKSAINLNNSDEMELEYNADPGAKVVFEIYTLTGDLIKQIPAQDYRGLWNGRNNKERDVASGFYLLMMRVDGRIVNKKPIKIGVIK